MNSLWRIVLTSLCSVVAEQSKLKQVQILIRHADRAPMFEFTPPESQRLFPRGYGEITDEGLSRARQQGEAFKQRYTKLGLLSEQANDSEIFVRSSPFKRVLMSAAAFSAPFTGSRAPRIHTTASMKEEQALVVHESIEHRCQVLARYNVSNRQLCRTAPLIAEFVKEYPDCASFTYSKIEAALAEVNCSGVQLDSALEKCARGDGRKIQFRLLSIRSAVGAEFDADRLRTVIGPLMSIVSRNVDDVIISDFIEGIELDATVRIYYTHNHVILAAAQALGIISEYGGRNPEFLSAIVVETWSTEGGFDIKIVIKDGLFNPFKTVAEYRFVAFKMQISPFVAADSQNVQWDENTSTVYNFAQFEKDVGVALPEMHNSSDFRDPRAMAPAPPFQNLNNHLIYFVREFVDSDGNNETKCAHAPCTNAHSTLTFISGPRRQSDATVVPAAVRTALQQDHVKMKDADRALAKIAKMIEGGADELIVISDFDHTMSRAYDEQGERCWTTHGVFDNAQEMADLAERCKQLAAHYMPIEFDGNLTMAQKIPHMEKWWSSSHAAIVASGVQREIMERLVQHANIKFRDAAASLLMLHEAARVPLVMFSAGIGDIISIFLKQRLGAIPSNVHLISNMMTYNDKNIVSGFSEPLIHTFNKNGSVISKEEVHFFHEMRKRDNVILLGDSMGDLHMDVGVENHREEDTLKIAFLNKASAPKESLLPFYLDGYDIVIVDDQSMDIPRQIVEAITAIRK